MGTPPAGTDWTSWDLDLGILAHLALVPKYPKLRPPNILGSPLISVSGAVLGNPVSPLSNFYDSLPSPVMCRNRKSPNVDPLVAEVLDVRDGDSDLVDIDELDFGEAPEELGDRLFQPGFGCLSYPPRGRLEVNQVVEGVRRCDGALIDGDVVLAVQGAPHPRRLVLAPPEVHLLLVILGPVLNCKTEFG